MNIRDTAQRQEDARRRLAEEDGIWLATASPDGEPHVVPLSLAWDEGRIVLATPSSTPTARNAASTGTARAHLDDVYDVVVVSGDVEVMALAEADPDVVQRYADRVGWDPRDEDDDWVLLVLTPQLVLCWNSIGEHTGRVIMRDGHWIDSSC